MLHLLTGACSLYTRVTCTYTCENRLLFKDGALRLRHYSIIECSEHHSNTENDRHI